MRAVQRLDAFAPILSLQTIKLQFSSEENVRLDLTLSNTSDRAFANVTADIYNADWDVIARNLKFDFSGSGIDFVEPFKSGGGAFLKFGDWDDIQAHTSRSVEIDFNNYVGAIPPGVYRIPYSYYFSYRDGPRREIKEATAKGALCFTVTK